MVYKHFRTICITRVLLLGATIFLFFYLIFQTTYYATIFIVGGITSYQIYSLIHFVEKTNRDLTRFFLAIKHSDFTQSFTGAGLGSTFNGLKTAFSEVLQAFQQARAEKEEHLRYVQTVVQHVGIGLISFQPNGEVELINNSAKRVLRSPQLRNIRFLESFSRPLVDTLLRLKPGERALVKVHDRNELLQLMIYATEFRLRGKKFTLVSIQDIHSELEEKEMEAWHKLIRVLTHEIMNSVTPISSLASTANDLLIYNHGSKRSSLEITNGAISDLRDAMQTIHKRSEGLLHFVEAYRNLTRIPKPDFKIFAIGDLFARVQQLMTTQIEEGAIDFRVEAKPDSLELTADPELIEQVLINLLKNSIQAVENQPEARIELIARMDEWGRVIIQVGDSGPGILDEVQDKIFIPFFTTKQEGSGIGLSLSRQIMRLHRGTISVQSIPNVETVFTLAF